MSCGGACTAVKELAARRQGHTEPQENKFRCHILPVSRQGRSAWPQAHDHRHPALRAGDGLEAVLSGVVKGAGRQASAVPIVLFSYYCVGVPLSLLLGFQAGLKVWAAAQVA